ncbi:U1 snRNP protein [Coemansia sp. RSA 1199]|nr:U1 snRNP protein [Coemansia sp. RSA 1199]
MSMVMCIGVLCTAAVQITAGIGAKAGYPLADTWVLELQKFLGLAHFEQRATPHVSSSQSTRLSRRLVGTTDPQVLRPIIPGITLPTGHLWHYLLALAVCAIIHELGHAFAAGRARVPLRKLGVFVMGIYPGAFVELCKTKLDQASVSNRLRIVCAGVWHNAVTAFLIFAFVRSGGLSAVFSHTGWTRVTDGVVVTDVALNSPLYNRIPLLSTVYRIDDVDLQPSNYSNTWNTSNDRFGATSIARWTHVLTATTNRDANTAGYCASTMENMDDGLCCEMSPEFPLGESPDSEIFCFERFASSASHELAKRSPMCFDLRSVLERNDAASRCQSDHDCVQPNQRSHSYVGRQTSKVCVLPRSPFASSRVVRLYYRLPNSQTEHMLVYAGSPTALWLDVQVSSLLPRYSWLPHTLPSWIETLLQYILSFSLAFCLLNALPAYYLDGDLAFKLLITAVEQRRARVAGATKCNILASAESKPLYKKELRDSRGTAETVELSRGGQMVYAVVTALTTALLVPTMNGSTLGGQEPTNSGAWVEYTSPDGRAYFYNRDTKVTTWEKPDELKTQQELDSVWKEYAKDGRPYWYNTRTKQSTWTRPDVPNQPIKPTEPHSSMDQNNVPRQAMRRERSRSRRSASRGPRSRQVPASTLEPRSRHEYKTPKEAEHAFNNMLKRHKVRGDWSWEKMLRAVVNDPDYRSLKTLSERKEAFQRYVSAAQETELEQRREEQRKQKADFFALLDTLPISEYTRFRKVKHLAGEHKAFCAVPEKERVELFDAYVDELLEKVSGERRHIRTQHVREATEYLGALPISSKWTDVKDRLLEKFGDQMMPILHADSEKRVPMDVLYFGVRDKDSVDPESGLCMLDLLDIYEHAMTDAERSESDRRKREKDKEFRQQRQARDAFRQLVNEHRAEFTPSSTWSEFYPQIKQHTAYTAMLGQPGSTPQELFWDTIEELSDEMYNERKQLESAMRSHNFHMHVDTVFAKVCEFAQSHCTIDAGHMEYIFEQLVIKCKRREEEEAERKQRHERRLLDTFKYALYDLRPELTSDSKWDTESARINKLAEYKAIDNEILCREAFDLVIERMKERTLRKRRDSGKRSRSPEAGAADKRTRHGVDKCEDRGSSDLEEGEMVS